MGTGLLTRRELNEFCALPPAMWMTEVVGLEALLFQLTVRSLIALERFQLSMNTTGFWPTVLTTALFTEIPPDCQAVTSRPAAGWSLRRVASMFSSDTPSESATFVRIVKRPPMFSIFTLRAAYMLTLMS